MDTSNADPSAGSFSTPPDVVDSFLDAKLHRPAPRDDWVHRARLLETVAQVCDRPVTLIAAPAGYGKTTLVAQWLDEARPRAAWLSLDSGDNDPNQLWSHIAAALGRAGCALPGRQRRRGVWWSRAPGSVLSTIIEALSAMTSDIILVLDDFHFIHDATCHDQVELLIEHLPAQAHLVVMTRADPGLRLGRLRAAGELLELRADDLSFTTAEAAALLASEGTELDEDSTELLVQRTEGWPAGLYLATLSMTGKPDPASFVRSFSGSNRFIGEYLTEEVLYRHPDDVREFITMISVLDRFSASLCDHVTETSGSAALLNHLEHTNLFLVPLDDDRRWYRFHHLFATVARSELEITRPERVDTLHARAATWFSEHAYVDEAIKHAIAADRADIAGAMVQGHWLRYVDAGRIATVLGWIESVGQLTHGAEPSVGVTAAWMAALTGDQAALTARMADLEPFWTVGPLPDGSRSVESATAMITGLFGYGGPAEMMTAAQRAVALETDQDSPFYSVAQAGLGHAAYVAGELDHAAAPLENVRRNQHAPAIIQALGLAIESLIAGEHQDLALSRERAEEAMWIVEAHGLRAVPQASLAYTALGGAQAADDDLPAPWRRCPADSRFAARVRPPGRGGRSTICSSTPGSPRRPAATTSPARCWPTWRPGWAPSTRAWPR